MKLISSKIDSQIQLIHDCMVYTKATFMSDIITTTQNLIVSLDEIYSITKSKDSPGFQIRFKDGKSIHLTKRRTIIALLVLIHKGTGTQADLAQGNTTIPEIRKILGDKLPVDYVSDFYSDANKPFSELWNEEGFSFITNVTLGKVQRSKGYLLNKDDHIHLFSNHHKALRKAPSNEQSLELIKKQQSRCNFCGSKLLTHAEIKPNTFARDHVSDLPPITLPPDSEKSPVKNHLNCLSFCA